MKHAVVICLDAEILRPIGESWSGELKDEEFGFKVEMEAWLGEMNRLIKAPNSMVMLLYEDTKMIGCMGLEIFRSPLSGELMANERFWYVLPDHRGISSLRLVTEAEKLAKTLGCKHFILNASKMASGMHDKMVKLYEKLKFRHWESVFIKSLE